MQYFKIAIAILIVLLVSISVYSQTLNPTQSLNYPFKKSDHPDYTSSNLLGCESMKRDQSTIPGWFFLEYADGYPSPVTWVWHPAWDMNIIGTSGSNDVGANLKAIADGEVISPSAATFDANKQTKSDGVTEYYIPSDWNELLIKHNLAGKEWITAYGHSDTIYVKEGSTVSAGDIVAELGEVGATNMGHLHLEIRNVETHPSATDADYWFATLQVKTNVQSWYTNPELFIKGYEILGMTSTGDFLVGDYEHKFRTTYDKFNALNENKTGTTDGDRYQYWDQVVDRGDGDIYVHYWPNDSHTNRIALQDLKVYYKYDHDNDPGTADLLVDEYAALVYNESENYVFYSEGDILDYWFTHTGYDNFGPPFTNKITANFANSHNILGSDFALPGDLVEVQKYRRISDAVRKTIVKNLRTGNTDHYPVSEYSIGGDQSPDGKQWYFIVDSYPENDIPWPRAGVVTPTGSWFTKPDTYQFVLHDENGDRVGGSAFTAPLTEGNQQEGSPMVVFTPTNLTAQAVSGTQINLSWQDNDNPSGTEYRISRNSSYLDITSNLTYSDTGLDTNTTYYYQVTAVYDGQQSSITDKVYETTYNGGNPPPSTVTVTSPNGGEQILMGDSLQVTWSGISAAQVDLSRDNGQNWSYMGYSTGTSHKWKTTPPASDQCIVRVRDNTDANIFDLSDNPFTIGDPNDPPVAQNLNIASVYPDSIDINVSSYVSDPQGSGTINWNSLQVTGTSGGTTDINGSVIKFMPSYGVFGSAQINYKVADDKGEYSNVATISIDVQVVTSEFTNGDFENGMTGWIVDATGDANATVVTEDVRYSKGGESHSSNVLYLEMPYDYRGTTETLVVSQQRLHFTAGTHTIDFDDQTCTRISKINFRLYSPVLDSVLYEENNYSLWSRDYFEHQTLSFVLDGAVVETEFIMDCVGQRDNGEVWLEDMTIDSMALAKQVVFETPMETKANPNSYELSQNYPNPFNPETQIRYKLPEASNVVLKIYNIFGQEVGTLANQRKNIGVHTVTWNASNVSAGIYFYQLKAGNYSVTKKMILLK